MPHNLVPDHIVSGQGNGGIPTHIRFHICGLMHTLLDYAVSRVYLLKSHIKSTSPVTNKDIRRGIIYEIISPDGVGKKLHEIFNSIMASAAENVPQMGIYEQLVQTGKISLDVATTMKKTVAYAQFMLEMNLLNEYKQSLFTVVINRIPIEDLIYGINEDVMKQRQREDENTSLDNCDFMDEDEEEDTYEEDEDNYEEDEDNYEEETEDEKKHYNSDIENNNDGCETCDFYKQWENLESLFSEWKPNGIVGDLCVQAINSIPP